MVDGGSGRSWLADLRVLDLSRLLPGPFCSLLLADMGADVVKIERPGGGDYARGFPPHVGDGMGAVFAAVNRNKRAVGLDLESAGGKEAFRRLAAEADVVVESFRPGAMDRLGLGWRDLRTVNEELIYCSISGYGQTGPLRERAGHDLNFAARAGILRKDGGDEPPEVPVLQIADIAGGLYGAVGVLGALHGRERGAGGEHLDISMTEGALSFQLPQLAVAGEPSGGGGPGSGILEGEAPAYGVYRTADDEYLAVGALEPKFWSAFVRAIDEPGLIGGGLSEGEKGEEVRERVAEILAERSLAEWMEAFEGEDVCCEPVHSLEEVLEDELFRARRVFFEMSGVTMARTPVTPAGREHTEPPGPGEHTREVLAEVGYSEARLDELAESGAI